MSFARKGAAYDQIQDPVWKHSNTPLNDSNFDFEAWKTKHMTSSDEIGTRWVKEVKAKYGTGGDVKFACVGYWLVTLSNNEAETNV